MEKQHLKKLGYGFSALVLGLVAVNFFPLSGEAYAIPSAIEICDEEETAGCFVTVADHPELDENDEIVYKLDESDSLVFSGTYNGDLIAYLDGEPITGDVLAFEDDAFTLTLDFEEPGEHELKLRILQDLESEKSNAIFSIWVMPSEHEYDNVVKAVNINESFSVTTGIYGGYGAYKVVDTDTGRETVTDDDMTFTESGDGQYDVMPLTPGQYGINLIGFVESNGKWVIKNTDMYLTVVGATTEAATTITDVMNGQNEAMLAIEKAMDKYEEEHPDATWEEIDAEWDRLYEEIGQPAALKYANAFGDSAMAIDEAVRRDGKMIATAVSVDELNEADIEDEVKDAMLEKLDVTFASNVKYYNIDVNVYADGEFIGTLKELTGEQAVVLTGYEAAPAGFKRIFQVVRYHTYVSGFDETTGEPIEEVEVTVIDDVEFDAESGSIIFASDKFSTYAVAYKDVLAASVNTGAATDTEGASASASVSVSVIAAIAAIALFGAVKFVKAKRN